MKFSSSRMAQCWILLRYLLNANSRAATTRLIKAHHSCALSWTWIFFSFIHSSVFCGWCRSKEKQPEWLVWFVNTIFVEEQLWKIKGCNFHFLVFAFTFAAVVLCFSTQTSFAFMWLFTEASRSWLICWGDTQKSLSSVSSCRQIKKARGIASEVAACK